MTDFRALCAELLEWAERTSSHYFIQADVVVRARAALAEQPVEPTRAVLARWGTSAIQPVPVSERLPGPEDCDADDGCWWWHPDHKEDDFDDGWILLNPKWAGGRRDSDDSPIYTHWLPANALPAPEAP
jgi:hypothetical protein